jgi:hypothetical protein
VPSLTAFEQHPERRIYMKKTLALALLAVVPATTIVSCETMDLVRDPNQQALILELEEARTVAVESGDTEEVARIDEQITAIEAAGAREQAQGIVGLVSALPVVGPFVAPLSPLLLGLAPLLGRRGRKHAMTLVGNLNPFSKTGTWRDAFGTLGRYLGILHSSPESERAAEGTPV